MNQGPNPNMCDSIITPADLVKEPEILKFFMEDIDKLLDTYEPGKIEHKPDVTKQLAEIKENRNNLIKQYNIQQTEYNNTINKINMLNPQILQNTINQQSLIIQQLSIENGKLKEQVLYFENKIKQFINEKIQEKNNKKILDEKTQEKHINLSNLGPDIA